MVSVAATALAAFAFAMGYALRCAISLPARRALPPATARQIKRARNASRAHLPSLDDFDNEVTR